MFNLIFIYNPKYILFSHQSFYAIPFLFYSSTPKNKLKNIIKKVKIIIIILTKALKKKLEFLMVFHY